MKQSNILKQVIPVVIGSSYNAYGIIRSFAQEGISSVLVSAKKNFIQYSKYLVRHVTVTNVTENEDAFIDQLIEMGKEMLPVRGMLFPTHDEQVTAIAKHAGDLAPYFEIPFSDLATCQKLMDKDSFAALCEKIGIPTIRGKLVNSVEELHNCVLELGFPILIKPNITDDALTEKMGEEK